MTKATGTYIVKMDSRGRIFVIEPVGLYLGHVAGKESGVYCRLGPSLKKNTRALFLLRLDEADKIIEVNQDPTFRQFDDVENLDTETQSGRVNTFFRPVQIKSNRIQFNLRERARLNLPKDDSRIILQGTGLGFVIWAADEFSAIYPEVYEYYGFGEAEDDESEE